MRLFPRLKAGTSNLEFGLKRVVKFVDNEPDEDSADFEVFKEVETSSVSEKKIGFEGIADAATGYYCLYDGGKVKAGKRAPVHRSMSCRIQSIAFD